VWRLNPVAKFACLAEIGAVLKLVSVFPRTFATVHLLSKLPPFQTRCDSIFKPLWCFISYSNHQEKVRVLFSQSHFHFSWLFLLLFGLILCSKYLGNVKWVWRVLLVIVSICFTVVQWKCVFHCSDICLLLKYSSLLIYLVECFYVICSKC